MCPPSDSWTRTCTGAWAPCCCWQCAAKSMQGTVQREQRIAPARALPPIRESLAPQKTWRVSSLPLRQLQRAEACGDTEHRAPSAAPPRRRCDQMDWWHALKEATAGGIPAAAQCQWPMTEHRRSIWAKTIWRHRVGLPRASVAFPPRRVHALVAGRCAVGDSASGRCESVRA